MFGAISRRLVTGGALLLAALLAADAAVDDDLPDLADQIAQMASEVALELQQVCPPASPSDQAAFDRCRRSLFGDSALRRTIAPRLLWGRRNQDAGAALKNTNLTQFAPDVIAGLYLSLFMYSGEYSTEYVERERLYLIRLRAGFRNLLPPGQFPYPFWHAAPQWGVYQAANSVLLMGWSGRAPAPPASEAGEGHQRQGARHVSDTQYRDRRDRHRYRQELVPRRGPRCARRHRAAAKVVAWPSGSAARQYTALPDRHGSLRRRTSPEPQTRIAWSRCQVDAGQICPPL